MGDNLPEPLEPLTKADAEFRAMAEKAVLSEIAHLNQAGATIGRWLRDLQDERLYRSTHVSFADYCLETFGISKSTAYRMIAVAKDVAANPEMPAPSQYALEKRTKAQSDVPIAGQIPAPIVPRRSKPAPKTDPSPAPVIDAASAETTPEPIPTNEVDRDERDRLTAELAEAQAANGRLIAQMLAKQTDDAVAASSPEGIAASTVGLNLVASGKASLGNGSPEPLAHPASDPARAALSALLLLLTNADLAAIGRLATADEWGTILTAVDEIKAGRPSVLRAVPSPSKTKTAAKGSDAKCDHPRVSCVVAKTKGKANCRLCGQEIDVARIGA